MQNSNDVCVKFHFSMRPKLWFSATWENTSRHLGYMYSKSKILTRRKSEFSLHSHQMDCKLISLIQILQSHPSPIVYYHKPSAVNLKPDITNLSKPRHSINISHPPRTLSHPTSTQSHKLGAGLVPPFQARRPTPSIINPLTNTSYYLSISIRIVL